MPCLQSRFAPGWLVFSTATSIASTAAHATAGDAPAASDLPAALDTSQRRTVALLRSTTEHTDSSFVSNLRGQLTEMDLVLTEIEVPQAARLVNWVQQAATVAAAESPWLVAWVTHDSNQTNVFLYDPKGPHLYARQVTTSDSPSAASEAILLILRSAIQARIDGAALEMAEIALPKPAPTEQPAVMRRPAGASHGSVTPQALPHWALGMSATLEHPVSPGPWQAGIAARSWARARGVRFGLGYSLFPDLTIATQEAVIQLRRHPFEGFAGVQFGSTSVAVVVESGLGVDLIRRETSSATVPLAGLPPESRWVFAVLERVRVDLCLMAPLWLTAAAGVQVPLNAYAFDVAVAEQQHRMARLLPVRPSFELGLFLGWQ